MMTKFLFWFQVIMAWVYMVPQTRQILKGETGGLTLALWLMFMGYLLISLSLSILSYKEKKEKIRFYTVLIFAQWNIFILFLFLLGLNKIRWTNGDTVVSISVAILSIITICYYRSLKDPMARGFLAMWCKGVPQLWLACVICQANSSEGLPPLSLLASHATMWSRFIQIYISGRRDGWDRPTKGLLLGESSNVATWTIVTIVWFLMR
ncbi:hypothetical protein K8R42_05380 [bacterium]|nr:hypothetical protein [bacterium]